MAFIIVDLETYFPGFISVSCLSVCLSLSLSLFLKTIVCFGYTEGEFRPGMGQSPPGPLVQREGVSLEVRLSDSDGHPP
jgi:hypothetical protein